MPKIALLLPLAFIFASTKAQIVWTGSTITFVKPTGVSATSAAGQDKITNSVILTRDVVEGIFNIAAEGDYRKNISPVGTEWAYGSLSNYNTLTYSPWETWHSKNPPSAVNKPAVLHLTGENIYIGITFTSWGGSGTGSFSYTRTTAGVLPITLKSFSATLVKQNAILNWTTATEIDNDHFEVEHSINGKDFNSIGQVRGNGSSTAEHVYNFVQENVSAGKHFYRLTDIDRNGNKRYSQIIALAQGSSAALQVYPNPASAIISVNAATLMEGSEYSITSLNGQTVLKGLIRMQQIDVQRLSAGQYWLFIKTKEGEVLKSLFLKK